MIAPRQTCSYAGLDLWPTSLSTQLGRDVAEHRPARGDGAQVFDRGRTPRRDTLTVPLTGTAEEITAARAALVALGESGEARLFVHPLDGSWMARLSELGDALSAEGATVTLTLTEDVPFTEITTDPLETASIQDVEAMADAYDQALADVDTEALAGLEAVPTGAETLALCEGWTRESGHAETRAQLESYRAGGAEVTNVLHEAEGSAAHRAALALMELRGTVELYWLGLQRVTAHYHKLSVPTALPLVVWLTELYGAADAARLMDEVLRLNTVVNPLGLPAGTQLTLPRL